MTKSDRHLTSRSWNRGAGVLPGGSATTLALLCAVIALLLSFANPAAASGLRTYRATATLDGRTALDLSNHTYPDLFSEGTPLVVLCQALGPEAYGSPIWDIVATEETSAAAGRPVAVVDEYVRTGYADFSPEIPRCSASDVDKLLAPPLNDADLQAEADRAVTFDEAERWWSSLGEARQVEQPWKARRAAVLQTVARLQALRVADIVETDWNPDAGLTSETDAIVRKVYRYYAQLFFQRPELRWAGLASLAGGPVYAGIQDAAYSVDLFNAEFVSHKLLGMQKAIFEDLAWQHQLYVETGIEGIRAVHAGSPGALGDAGSRNAHLVDGQSTELIAAWEDIASGDAGRVDRGNRVLTAQEQDAVLQKHYNELVERARLLTEVSSEVARSPVTGTDDWFFDIEADGKCWPPYSFSRLPKTHRDEEGCRRPNVAWWEDRQVWIFQHVLPRFTKMLAEDPTWIHAQIARPVEDRAGRVPPRIHGQDSRHHHLRRLLIRTAVGKG